MLAGVERLQANVKGGCRFTVLMHQELTHGLEVTGIMVEHELRRDMAELVRCDHEPRLFGNRLFDLLAQRGLGLPIPSCC